jgi:PAS domain S-box-containing protein
LIGQHFGALVHETSGEVADLDWTQAMETSSQELRGRLNLRHRDGTAIPAEFIAVASLDPQGQFAGANGSVRDMRERDRLERELTRSEERFRFLVQNSPDIVFSSDVEGRFTFLSAAIERMTGFTADELIGQHFSTIIESEELQVSGGRWEALVENPDQEVQATQVLKGRDGRLTPVDVRAVGIKVDGRFAGIQGATRDVSDQVRLQGELRRQAGELAAGEERAHLARELHDSVTQALFSMSLVTRSVELLLGKDPDKAREQLTQLRELQREALAEMRALIFELRPGNLEQDGLVRALKTHSSALQGRLGLPIVVESDLEDRLPLAAEEVLYRIAQEALHNVVKHAAARQVRLEVRRHESGGVRLRVEDDGKGFDPARVLDGHLGLTGMRARADRIGARFACTSGPGQGTAIEVTLDQAALDDLRGAAAAAGDAGAASTRAGETPSVRDG